MELRLRKIQLKKKNSFTDFTGLFFALAIIFGISIFFIVLSYAYGKMQPKLNEGLSNAATPEEGMNVTDILNKTDLSIIRFNVFFPFLLIGVFAFVLIMALMDRSHPAFLFIGLIVLAVALILGAVYSNVYEELTDHAEFSDTGDDYNIMSKFVENLPLIILILFVAIGMVLYIRSGGSQGY